MSRRARQEPPAREAPHVPDWAENWRKTQELKKAHPVDSTFSPLPPVLACSAGDLAEMPADAEDLTIKRLRALAYEHGREAGHVVTVVTSHVLTVFPEGAEVVSGE